MATKQTNPGEKQAKLPEEKQVNNQRSAQSGTPRDGQNSQTGKEGNLRKKRKTIALSSPGVEGEAWPSIVADPARRLLPGGAGATWAKFVVVEAVNPEEPLSRLSPWALQKGFQGISTSIKNIKRMGKTGSYLVECPDEKTSKMIMIRNATTFIDRKIKVTPHRTLNTCRGVITVNDNDVHEHLAEGLRDQGVTNVHQVSRGGKPTNTFFLTFGMPKPPEFLIIPTFSQRFKVRAFIPRPLQCFNCWRFGHPQSKCQADKICKLCGSKAHEGECPGPAKCSNCKGQHGPADKNCPTYKKEAAIQRIRAERGISFGEAKKVVEATDPPNGRSFADAAATTGQQTPAQNHQASTQPKRDLLKVQSSGIQFGVVLPEAIRCEALALAKGLAEELKAKRKKPQNTRDASAQFVAEAKSTKKKKRERPARAQKQAEKPEEQAPKPAKKASQAKPGGSSATKTAEVEQAKRPASPKDTPASAPQAAAGKPNGAGTTTTPTSRKGNNTGTTLKRPTLSFGDGVVVQTSGGVTFVDSKEKKRVRSPIRAPQQTSLNSTNIFDPLNSLNNDDQIPTQNPSEKAEEEEGIWHNPMEDEGGTDWS